MIFITGATGMVGAHLLLELAKDKQKIVALYRSTQQIEKVKSFFEFTNSKELLSFIEWRKGDLLDINSLNDAMQGCTKVYHCASFISFKSKDENKLRKTNIEGTSNILNTAQHLKVEKLCYISSIAALGDSESHAIITELTEWNSAIAHSDYAISKRGGEMEVWRADYEGLKTVIVNPGVIIGGYFWDSPSGIIYKNAKKNFPFYTKGTTGFVSIDDVTKACIKLMDSDISRENFILVSENKSYVEIQSAVAKSIGSKSPFIELKPFMTSLLSTIEGVISSVFRTQRHLTKANATALHTSSSYDGTKICSYIDFKYTPIDTAIKETGEIFIKSFSK